MLEELSPYLDKLCFRQLPVTCITLTSPFILYYDMYGICNNSHKPINK